MKYFRRSSTGLFASASLSAHLIRGAVAFAALAWALAHQATAPFLALGAGVVALFAFRGCPVCWSVGLVETLRQKFRRPPGGEEQQRARESLD
jgi:hypothetical protein